MSDSFVWICLLRQSLNYQTHDHVSSVHKSKKGALFYAASKYLRAQEQHGGKPVSSMLDEEVEAFAEENAVHFTCVAQFEDDTGGGFQFYKETDTLRFLVYKEELLD
jgi:hypothetical protein